jgi:hypothetical protein
VATDQKINLTDNAAIPSSAIDNEIATYRAISGKAIFSIVCGIFASCSFASLYFLAFSICAVLFGVLALRAIKQFPDMYTGTTLANAGIGLGLVFGLAAFTYDTVTNYNRSSSAGKFAQAYADVMISGSLGDVLLQGLNPESRKNKKAADVEAELEAVQAKPKEKMAMEQKINPIRTLRKRLQASKDEKFHFVDIETHGIEETHGAHFQYYAVALFEVEGPGSAEFPEKKQLAAAVLKGVPSGRITEWWVDDIKFPYVPKSIGPVESKPVDDGHGHAH